MADLSWKKIHTANLVISETRTLRFRYKRSQLYTQTNTFFHLRNFQEDCPSGGQAGEAFKFLRNSLYNLVILAKAFKFQADLILWLMTSIETPYGRVIGVKLLKRKFGLKYEGRILLQWHLIYKFRRWTHWVWFSLTTSKTTLVLSKRLNTVVDDKLSLFTNWGKEYSAIFANFPSKTSRNYSNGRRLNASEPQTET